MNRLRIARRLATAMLTLAAFNTTARLAAANVIASESFVYAPGPLNGQNGGSGWASAWMTGQPNVFVVQSNTLGSGIDTQGGSLFHDGSKTNTSTGARIFRQLDLGIGSIASADS